MKEILDSDLGQELSILSDFQLVGFLNSKVKYDSRILQDVQEEIIRRKLSKDKIDILSNKYNKINLIRKGEFQMDPFNIFLLTISLLLLIFSHPVLLGVIACIITGFSILAVKIKFEKGILENRLWNNFSITIAILFCLLIGILIII